MVTPGVSDATLIERSLTDPRAFEGIFDRHFDAVHRFATGRIGPQDAADVTAETFARAFVRRQRFRLDRPSALPWLFGIAINVCRERARRTSRGRTATGRLAASFDLQTEGFEAAVADRIDAERLRPDLVVALRSLSDAEYALLMLASESDLTYGQMAATLGVPVGTVRSRLFRARARVRQSLADSGTSRELSHD